MIETRTNWQGGRAGTAPVPVCLLKWSSLGGDKSSRERPSRPAEAVERINDAFSCQGKYLNANLMMELGDLTDL